MLSALCGLSPLILKISVKAIILILYMGEETQRASLTCPSHPVSKSSNLGSPPSFKCWPLYIFITLKTYSRILIGH